MMEDMSGRLFLCLLATLLCKLLVDEELTALILVELAASICNFLIFLTFAGAGIRLLMN
jgi:hypothetical protein